MGRNWAITIGIDNYHYLKQLRYAQKDAEAIQNLFVKELGFQHVYHFTEDAPPIAQDYGPNLESSPTCTALRRFLRKRFEQSFLHTGDNLWFFFAGHGVRHQDRDYLIPLDGDSGDLEGSAIPIAFIVERLRCSGADNIILVIDACRSHESCRNGLGIGQENQQGVITIYSCSPQELSYEIDELSHGSFTYSLIQGLRTQGEQNCATVERICDYLYDNVPKLNQLYDKPLQLPYCAVEPAIKYHLVLLPQKANYKDIEILELDASASENAGQLEFAGQLWVRLLSISPANHAAIEGIKRIERITTVKKFDQSHSNSGMLNNRSTTVNVIRLILILICSSIISFLLGLYSKPMFEHYNQTELSNDKVEEKNKEVKLPALEANKFVFEFTNCTITPNSNLPLECTFLAENVLDERREIQINPSSSRIVDSQGNMYFGSAAKFGGEWSNLPISVMTKGVSVKGSIIFEEAPIGGIRLIDLQFLSTSDYPFDNKNFNVEFRFDSSQ